MARVSSNPTNDPDFTWQYQHKPQGIRIVKGEPRFLKELERAVASCFRFSDEGTVQEQMMSWLPFAYVQAVNIAISFTFYGTTRTEINEKRDHYKQRLSDAIHAIMHQPDTEKSTQTLNNEVQLVGFHIQQAEIAHGAFTKSGGRPIDWFRRCLLMECFASYAKATGKLPTHAPGEAWHVIAWTLQKYYKSKVVQDMEDSTATEFTVRPEDVTYLQDEWNSKNREGFGFLEDTLTNWPTPKARKTRK